MRYMERAKSYLKEYKNKIQPTRLKVRCYIIIVGLIILTCILWKNDRVDDFIIEELLQLFNVFWGVSITTLIFIIEISGKYKYGISLKRIINRSLGIPLIALVGSCFIFLCPMAHFASASGYNDTLFFMCIEIGGLFVASIIYISYMSIRKNIEKLIVTDSKCNIKRYCQMAREKATKIMRATYFMDQLLLSEMIEHVKMDNIFEIDAVINVICDIIGEPKFEDNVRDTTMEYTFLMAVVRKIITRSNLSKEEEREQICKILIELWRNLSKKISRTEGISQREVSIMLQLMLPFIECNNSEGDRCFIKIWNRINGTEKALIYILLYIEYQHTQEESYNHLGNWAEDMGLRSQLSKSLEGNFDFDIDFAHRNWIDWNEFYRLDEQLDQLRFWGFVEDVINLHGKAENIDGCMRSFVFREVRLYFNDKN